MDETEKLKFLVNDEGKKSHVVFPVDYFLQFFTQEPQKTETNKLVVELNQDMFEAIEGLIEDRGLAKAMYEVENEEDMGSEEAIAYLKELRQR
ncbi:MAG: hypothetical protein HOA17_09590 [Candidatus Melainabacteria bacterium]|jgi:hypothetical protein|nr:hypothetical protein [Candidatus Melainabacteria bacterium]